MAKEKATETIEIVVPAVTSDVEVVAPVDKTDLVLGANFIKLHNVDYDVATGKIIMRYVTMFDMSTVECVWDHELNPDLMWLTSKNRNFLIEKSKYTVVLKSKLVTPITIVIFLSIIVLSIDLLVMLCFL